MTNREQARSAGDSCRCGRCTPSGAAFGVMAAVALLAASGCNDLVGLGLTQIGVTDGNNGTASTITFSDKRAVVSETIYPFGDYDVYNLGAYRTGDRLRLEVDPAQLHASLALVDGDTSTLLDGLDGNAPDRLSIEHVVRRDLSHLLLYVGPGHVRMPPLEILPVPTGGAYSISITLAANGSPLPGPRPQTVVLDFKGGVDQRYFGHPLTLAPFRPAEYHAKLAGFDELIKQVLAETVRATFREYNLRVLTSDDPAPAEPASRIFITAPGFFDVGGTNYAGGQVRFVDFGNRDPQDVAIVSPASFQDNARRGGDPAEFGRALGELAAHEIGHLLGLTHQREGLMSYNRSIELVNGPLAGYFGFTDPRSAALFPATPELIQDTTAYLEATLGRRPDDAAKQRDAKQKQKSGNARRQSRRAETRHKG